MSRTAVVVYRWGRPAQNHLIRHAWRPWVVARRTDGSVGHALYDRFDTRGPHLTFFVEWAGDATDDDATRRQWVDPLCAELQRGIEAFPDPTELSDDALAEYHAGCRGKAQCRIDRWDGFGDQDSIHAVDHPEDGYPFGLARGLATCDTVWSTATELALWAAERLSTEGDGLVALPALATVIAFDHELMRRGKAAAFWSHYAGTLRLDLAERVAAGESPDAIVRDLPALIGEANQRRLAALWAAADRLPGPPGVDRLLDAVGPDPRLGRECCHLLLKQLGWPVPHHVPAVLYAWWRAASGSTP